MTTYLHVEAHYPHGFVRSSGSSADDMDFLEGYVVDLLRVPAYGQFPDRIEITRYDE